MDIYSFPNMNYDEQDEIYKDKMNEKDWNDYWEAIDLAETDACNDYEGLSSFN